jgi:HD superfamily phosphohydrolase
MNKLIFDSIHKYIELEPELIEIIDTSEFQRLRMIKQLGIAYYVFLGASHNRFEHSIGVSYLSGLLIKNIKDKQPELNITDRDVILIKIAGLCHDLGHACFSHFFDNIFLKNKLNDNENIHHEVRSENILRYIIKKYKLNYTENEIDFISDLINSKNKTKIKRGYKKPKFMFEIVANNKSGLDCDKIDYLLRDTKNIGLNNSFEYNRLFNKARVIDNTICYLDKDAFHVYELFHTRFTMHKQIYQDPVINQIEYMILDVLNLVDEEFEISKNINDIEKFITYTDNILERIKIYSKNEYALEIINRIETRKLYKFVNEIIYDNKNEMINNKIIEFKNKIKENGYDNNIIILQFNINFNLKNKNPVDEIYFYNINNIDLKFKIKKKMVSLILPSIFEETITRFLIKNENDECRKICNDFNI